MFWQIGGAVDTTAPVRASAGSAPVEPGCSPGVMSRMKSGPDGSLIPMAEQDRSRRDRSATEEGIALVTAALPRGLCRPEIGFWFVSWVFLDLRRLAHTR